MNNMLTGQGGYGSILNNRMGGLGSLLGGTGGGNFSFGGPPQQQQQQQMGMFQQGGFGGGFNPMMGGFGGGYGGFGQQFGGFNPMMGGGMGGFGFNPMMGGGMGGFGGYGGFGQQFGGFNPMMGGGMGGFGGFSGGGFGIPFGGGFNMPFGMGGFSPYGMGAFNPYAQQMEAMLQQRGGVPGQYDPGYMHQGPGGGREMPTNRLTDDARLIGNNPPPGMMLNPDYRPSNRLTDDVLLSDLEYRPIQGGTIAPGRPSPPPMREMDLAVPPGGQIIRDIGGTIAPGRSRARNLGNAMTDPARQKYIAGLPEDVRATTFGSSEHRNSPETLEQIKQIKEDPTYSSYYQGMSDDEIYTAMNTATGF